MQLDELYSIAIKEYPHNICLDLCAAHSLHLSTKPTKKDLLVAGRYCERVERLIRQTLWQSDDIDLVVNLCFAVYDVEITHALQGLGGCVAKTFKQVLEGK